MKKLLGTILTISSILGFASANNIYATEKSNAPTLDFSNVETKARLNFVYDLNSLEIKEMHIKFGGVVQNNDTYDYFDEKAEHGVIVVPTEGYDILNNQNSTISEDDFNKLFNNKYVLPFTETMMGNVVYPKLGGSCKQFAWVIDADQLNYDFTFVAAMYEKKGAQITLAKPRVASIVSTVYDYINDSTIEKSENINAIFNFISQKYKKYEMTEDFLKQNLAEGNVENNKNYNLYVHAWNEKNALQDINRKILKINNKFEFYLNNEMTDCNFMLGDPKYGFDWNNKFAKSNDLLLLNSKVVKRSDMVTYKNISSFIKDKFNNKNIPSDKILCAWVWENGKDGKFIEVKNDELTVEAYMDTVIFVYKNDSSQGWGENNSNIYARTCEMKLGIDFQPVYQFKEEGFPSKFGWGVIDRNNYEVWARLWVDGSRPFNERWVKVDNYYKDNVQINQFIAPAAYNRVIFVIRKKDEGLGFNENSVNQTHNIVIQNGVIKF